ncbi:NifU family protein [Mycobacterium shigaense]|uniref:NifU family protein n=1 Tax=Mycobacterium shigaense TaxID=722731 RepID=UPI0013C30002|nr:NifU family protein [Mycobacterium shigaense]
MLHVHGGDLEVLSVSEQGVVQLCFHDACRACPLKAVTYAVSVRQRLMEIPGVTDVVMQDVRLSAAAIARVKAAYRDHPLDVGSYANDESPTGA